MTEFAPYNALPYKKMLRSYALVLTLVCLALYMNTLSNGFVMDDNPAIVRNSIVSSGISAIPKIFSTPYHYGFVNFINGLYRPVTLSMFAVEYQIGGGSAFPGHLMNVLLFAADVLLLFFFLTVLFGQEKMTLSFIAALLFALLPIHTEVVANIKSQDELLCFFFSFLSLLVLMKYADSGKIAALSGGMFLLFLALLSKETAAVFVGINAVLFLGFYNRKKARTASILLGTVAVVALFIFLRFSVLKAYNAVGIGNIPFGQNALVGISSFWSREATAILIAGKYLLLMLVPLGLVCDYSYNTIPPASFTDLSVMFSLLVYLIILATGIYRMLRFKKDWLAFSIAFFLISFALFANIFFLVGATMAERFMFFPSVGWCMAGAMLIYRLLSLQQAQAPVFRNRIFLSILLPLTIFYGSITLVRNRNWKDEKTLFTHDVQLQPNNFRLHQYLGYSLLASSLSEDDTAVINQQYKEAIPQIKLSAQIFPNKDVKPYGTIGMGYIKLRQFDSAGKYLEQSLAQEGEDTLLRNNLAGIYFQKEAYQKLIEMCRINIEDFPDYDRAYVNMGAAYLKLGQYDSAKAVLSKAVSLAPDDRKARYFLTIAQQYAHRQDSVLQHSH